MSGRKKPWAEIKDVVRGVNQNNVEARVIVEALLISKSKEDFVSLIVSADKAGASFEELCWGGDE